MIASEIKGFIYKKMSGALRSPAPSRPKERSADHVREALEHGIVNGRFLPGQRLDAVKLAQRFGVSRTPIREPPHELLVAALLDPWARRGAIVAAIARGDADGAEVLLKAHVIVQGGRFSDLIASLPKPHDAAE